MHTKSLQSCPTLCDPMACSPPGSSVHGILQGRHWSGKNTCPSPEDLPDPGIKPASHISCIGKWVLYHQHHVENPGDTGRLLILSISNKTILKENPFPPKKCQNKILTSILRNNRWFLKSIAFSQAFPMMAFSKPRLILVSKVIFYQTENKFF